jgi:hypothetical protein
LSLLFSDFKTHVRNLTRENSSSGTYRYASDTNLLAAWKLIIPKINMLTHSNMVSNIANPILSYAGQAAYDLPSHIVGGEKMMDIYEVYYNGKPLNYLSLTEARMSSGIGNPWWNRPGDPIRFMVVNNQIHLYPVPPINNVPIQVFGTMGVKMPTSGSDTTTTSQLDDRLSEAIIAAGCQYIMMSRREYESAQLFDAQMKDHLKEYQTVQIDRLIRGGAQMVDVDPHEKF